MKLLNIMLLTFIVCVVSCKPRHFQESTTTNDTSLIQQKTPLFSWTTNESALKNISSYLKNEIDVAKTENAKVGINVKLTSNNRAGFGLYASGDLASSKNYGPILIGFYVKKQIFTDSDAGIVDILPSDLIRSPTPAIRYLFLNNNFSENLPFTRYALVIRDLSVIDEKEVVVINRDSPEFGLRRSFASIPPPDIKLDILQIAKYYPDHLNLLIDLISKERNILDDEENLEIRRTDMLLMIKSELMKPMRPDVLSSLSKFENDVLMESEQAKENPNSLCKKGAADACVQNFIKTAMSCYKGFYSMEQVPSETQLHSARFLRYAHSMQLLNENVTNFDCTENSPSNLGKLILENYAQKTPHANEHLKAMFSAYKVLFSQTNLDFWNSNHTP